MSHPLYAAPKQRSCEKVPHTAYQVDYVAVNCGKIVAASKRRIRFKFGYTNLEALSEGKTGQECRGSEHEVIITWSLSSGKQAIAFDQHEVYFDVGDSTQSKITHTWKDQFGHTLAVKVHAANVSTKANPDPDWKQYDLFIDGVSFFRMPKIFEIGIYPKEEPAGSTKFASRFANKPSSAPPTQVGQPWDSSNNHMGSILPPDEPMRTEPKPVEVADLLSFDEFDAPAPVVAAPPQIAPAPAFAAPPQAAPSQAFSAPPQAAPAQAFAVPPQAARAPDVPAPMQVAPVQTNASFANTQSNNYAPAQAPEYASANPFAAPTNPFPAQNQGFANNVSPSTSPGMIQEPSAFQQNGAPFETPAQSNPFSEPTPTASYASQSNPVTPPDSSTALVPVQPAPTGYGVDGALKNLVNIDDLFGTSTAPVTKESVDAKRQEVNSHKSLGQLQGSNTSNPKKPVMNPFNAPPAYQQQQQQQGMYGGGYGAQQQQPQFNSFGQQPYAQSRFGY